MGVIMVMCGCVMDNVVTCLGLGVEVSWGGGMLSESDLSDLVNKLRKQAVTLRLLR